MVRDIVKKNLDIESGNTDLVGSSGSGSRRRVIKPLSPRNGTKLDDGRV
jgi:hypothetical protein